MRLKVFYLDDEVDLLELFVDTYEDEDLEIKIFTDPEEFVVAVSQDPPNLAVLDYRLPGTTGDRVACRLPKALPKVLVSGDLAIEPESDFLRLISKPYRPAEMLAVFDEVRKSLAGS